MDEDGLHGKQVDHAMLAWVGKAYLSVPVMAGCFPQNAHFCPHANLCEMPGSHPACVSKSVNQGKDPRCILSQMSQGFRITKPQDQQISVD